MGLGLGSVLVSPFAVFLHVSFSAGSVRTVWASVRFFSSVSPDVSGEDSGLAEHAATVGTSGNIAASCLIAQSSQQ